MLSLFMPLLSAAGSSWDEWLPGGRITGCLTQRQVDKVKALSGFSAKAAEFTHLMLLLR